MQEETADQRAARHALNQPLIQAFNELADQLRVDDSLADVPSIFEPPTSNEEMTRRRHARIFAELASDRELSIGERENAVRHIITCDPVRGVGALLELLDEVYASLVRQTR